MGATRLPSNVLNLKRFLLRQQVLTLYREVLKTVRSVADENQRKQLRDWARTDFKVNKYHDDEDTIKMLLIKGRRSLEELKGILSKTR